MPKVLVKKPTESNHFVYFLMSDIRLPFKMEGTVSYLPTWRPLKLERKEYEGDYMLLMLNTPEWDPHTTMYSKQ